MSDDYLIHYGTKMHSGRYPWGSGENPYQRLDQGSLRARVRELEKEGFTEVQIAEYFSGNTPETKVSTGDIRDLKTIEKNRERVHIYLRTRELHDKGYKNTEIAKQLGVTEGTVRNNLKIAEQADIDQLGNIVDNLKHQVAKKKYVDVGEGAHYALNCKETKLSAALMQLQLNEEYELHTIQVQQLGTTHKTTVQVLTKPGVSNKYLHEHYDKIHEIDESKVVDVNGDVKLGAVNPRSVDRKRILVKYDEDGGTLKDGVIELRRGVDDISLGSNNYAQVRIAVDDKYYMKGMAIYNDHMPPGVDIIYNSNKKQGTPDDKVFKKLDRKAEEINGNPFGATIKGLYDEERPEGEKELRLTQRYYIDKDGNKQLSCINIVNEEGTWGGWSKNLSSQFLSKQTTPLAKKQLGLAYKDSLTEFEDIQKVTEPTLKRIMLQEFAENCDSAAVDLKAAALPRQATKVLLPVPSLKDGEIYAPGYNTGEHVVLVRHPHAGPFEIPYLTVNNNHKEGKSVVGNSPDAIGINLKTAEQLSGADFDGDTAIVIPCDNVKIKHEKILKDLDGFNPKKYKLPDDLVIDPKTGNEVYKYPTIKSQTKQTEMGRVSNLITDMYQYGAPPEELARAVKHSMVVIDSEKHRLDYKQSEIDNGIAALKKKYQGGSNKGASTIISRASSEDRSNPEVRDYYTIDPDTGEKILKYTGRTYSKPVKDKNTGEVIGWKEEIARTPMAKMNLVKDAYELTSDGKGGTPMEQVYADYANNMKALANRARKESLGVADREYSPSAAKTYEKEVESLRNQLLNAQKNAPRERQAQLWANSQVKAQIADDPSIKEDKDRYKKIRSQALAASRARVGAKSVKIHFSDREWEAIQSGAIRKTELEKILKKADKDELRSRATPRANIQLSASKQAQIRAFKQQGKPIEDIAAILGLSVSTINRVLYS